MEELIFSEEFLTLSTAAEQLEFIRRKLKVEREIVNQISSLTVGQRNNPSWHLVRKGRLTASNFGSVINAKRVTPSLIKRLLTSHVSKLWHEESQMRLKPSKHLLPKLILKLLRRGCGLTSQAFLELPLMD